MRSFLAALIFILAGVAASASECLNAVKKASPAAFAGSIGLHYHPFNTKSEGITRTVETQVLNPGTRDEKKIYVYHYFDQAGNPLVEPALVDRADALKIPPAYRDIKISPDPDTHLQAVGLDKKGGTQYFYHEAWKAARAKEKFRRMVYFGEAQERLKTAVGIDLEAPEPSREFSKEKVIATVVGIMEKTMIRVGNTEYLTKNGSSGLTTMLQKDVTFDESLGFERVRFKFIGKMHKPQDIYLSDPELVGLVKQLMSIPQERLFMFLSHDGQWHAIESEDVNNYIRTRTGGRFTAKDFRTWKGTTIAARFLWEVGPPHSPEDGQEKVNLAALFTSSKLGNSPVMSLKAYIDPEIIQMYLLHYDRFEEAFRLVSGNQEKAVLFLLGEQVAPSP